MKNAPINQLRLKSLIKNTLRNRSIFVHNGHNCKLFQNTDIAGKRLVGDYTIVFNPPLPNNDYKVSFGGEKENVIAFVDFNGRV